MKKMIILLVVFALAGLSTAAAQVVPGKFELGTSASYYNIKFDDEASSMSYLNVPVRFGWYVLGGLEIEPEVQLFVPMGDSSGDLAYLAQGKILYNFPLAGVEPFLGGGAGIGNGLPIYGVLEGDKDIKTFVFTGIAGFKVHLGNSAALRVEYRFNRFSWDSTFALEKQWGNLHQVLVGVSIFL